MSARGSQSSQDLARNELSARIAFQEGVIRTWSAPGTRAPSVESTARSHSGFAWFDIAVCELMLGKSGAAALAFGRAAELMRASLEVMTPPSLATYTASLESAVLSGDRAIASGIAASSIPAEPRPSLIGDRLLWAQTLPALVRGEDDQVKVDARSAEKKPWYPGLRDALAALTERDRARLKGGLELMLVKHLAYAKAKSSWCYNAGPCLLCVPAAIVARLAAQRGMTVGDVRGRKAAIPLALVHSAPGESLIIEADFLPAALVAA